MARNRNLLRLETIILIMIASFLLGCSKNTTEEPQENGLKNRDVSTHQSDITMDSPWIESEDVGHGDDAHEALVKQIDQAIQSYNKKHEDDSGVPAIDSWEPAEDFWGSDELDLVKIYAESNTEVYDIDYTFWFYVQQRGDGQYVLENDDLDTIKSNVDLNFEKLSGFSGANEFWNSEVEIQSVKYMPITLQEFKYGYTPVVLTLSFDAGDSESYTYSDDVALYLPDTMDSPYDITNLKGKFEDGSNYRVFLTYEKNGDSSIMIQRVDDDGYEVYHVFVIPKE